MVKILRSAVAILAFAFLTFTPLVFAQSETAEAYEDIEETALAPDSPLYFLRNWQESIERFVANFQGDEALANLETKHAQRRVAEMKRLARLGKDDLLEKARERWEQHIQKAQERVENIQERRDEARERVLEAVDRHRTVLERVREQVPEKARNAIDRALENAKEHRNRVLERFTDENRQQIEERLKQKLENTIDRFQLNRDRFQEIFENKIDSLRNRLSQ